jgi:biofilm PGA synthesis lipoprotein PgaB
MFFINKKKYKQRFFGLISLLIFLIVITFLFPYHINFKKVFVSYFQLFSYKSQLSVTGNIDNQVANIFSSKNITQENKKDIQNTKSLPILLYHGIVEKADRFNMTKETFKNQMFALKEQGYQTVTLQDFEDFRNGTKSLPAKSFLLTFDDGRLDSYTEADPLLRALGYTAVMYVATDASLPPEDRKKSTYYVSSEDISKMIKSGRWEIGSHAIQDTGGIIKIFSDGSKGNFLSNKMWIEPESRLENEDEYEKRISREFSESKRRLEETFKVKVDTFSYPFGDYGQQSKNNSDSESVVYDKIKDNYKMAFKQVWPKDGEFSSNYNNSIPFYLRRVEIPTNWSGEELVDFMDAIEDKNIPFTDSFDKDSGWRNTWGLSSIEANSLKMKSTASTTGAFVFLDGTGFWKNYVFSTTFNWLKGTHVSLVARYKNSKNYQTCVFSKEAVRIESYVDGKPKKLAEKKKSFESLGDEVVLSVAVKDNFIKCLVGDSVIVFATIPFEEGGVGVKIWDKEFNNAEISIKNILIESTDN